jgi:hypothetical protein
MENLMTMVVLMKIKITNIAGEPLFKNYKNTIHLFIDRRRTPF